MRAENRNIYHGPEETMVRILTSIFTSPRKHGYRAMYNTYQRNLPLAAKTTALYPSYYSGYKRILKPQDFYYKYLQSLNDDALEIVLPDAQFKRMHLTTIDMLTDHLLPMEEIELINKGVNIAADLHRDAPYFPLGFYTCAIQHGDVLEDNVFAHEDTDIETVACIMRHIRILQIARNN